MGNDYREPSIPIDEIRRMLQFAKEWGLDPEYVLNIVCDLGRGLEKYDRLDDLMQMIIRRSESMNKESED